MAKEYWYKNMRAAIIASAFLLIAPAFGQAVSTGKVSTSAPTYVNGTAGALSLDTAGNLRTVGTSTPPSGGAATQVQGTAAAGSPPVGNPVQTGGTDGTNIQPISVDTSGRQVVVGTTAAAAAFSGNAIGVGSVSSTSMPTGDASGTFRPLLNNGLGGIDVVVQGLSYTPLDGISNNFSAPYRVAGGTRLAAPWVVGQYLFNGATWDRQFTCSNSAVVSVTAASTTQIVALSGSTVIRVCSFDLSISLTGTAKFLYGTGTNCAGAPADLTGAMNIATGGFNALSAAQGSLFRGAAGNALCIAAVTGNVTGFVTYAQY